MRGSNLLDETRNNTVFLFLENSCAMNLPQLSFFYNILKKASARNFLSFKERYNPFLLSKNTTYF